MAEDEASPRGENELLAGRPGAGFLGAGRFELSLALMSDSSVETCLPSWVTSNVSVFLEELGSGTPCSAFGSGEDEASRRGASAASGADFAFCSLFGGDELAIFLGGVKTINTIICSWCKPSLHSLHTGRPHVKQNNFKGCEWELQFGGDPMASLAVQRA